MPQANAVVKSSEDARATAEAGDFDSETDVGALGQSILDARSAGENVDAIYNKYESVAFTGLSEDLDAAKTEASRAEKANEEAVEKLNALVDAILLSDPDANVAALSPIEHATVPKLGDLSGLERLETRAKNYVTRGTASVENAEAIRASAAERFIESAKAVQSSQTTSATDSLVAT